MPVVRCCHTPFFPNLAGGMVLWYRGTIPGRLPVDETASFHSAPASLLHPPQNQCTPAMATPSCSVRLWMCVRGACMASMVPPCTNCEVVRPGDGGLLNFKQAVSGAGHAALVALTHCGDARHPGLLAACGWPTTVLMLPLTMFLGMLFYLCGCVVRGPRGCGGSWRRWTRRCATSATSTARTRCFGWQRTAHDSRVRDCCCREWCWD